MITVRVTGDKFRTDGTKGERKQTKIKNIKENTTHTYSKTTETVEDSDRCGLSLKVDADLSNIVVSLSEKSFSLTAHPFIHF